GDHLQPQACFDEVMMDGVDAYLPQFVDEFSQVVRDKWRGYDDAFRRQEVERLQRWALRNRGICFQVVLHGFHDLLTQGLQRSEGAHVHIGQTLGKTCFVAIRVGPMSEIVRKAFPNVMVFLQGLNCMLENGLFRARTQGRKQLAEIAGTVSLDLDQAGRRIEMKRLSRCLRKDSASR